MSTFAIDQLLDDLRTAGIPVRLAPGALMQVVFDICVFGATPEEACAAHGVASVEYDAWEANLRDVHGPELAIPDRIFETLNSGDAPPFEDQLGLVLDGYASLGIPVP